MRGLKECTFCHKKIYRIAGHGLCAACYYREKKRGTLEYKDRSRKPCSVDGCGDLAVAKGLCSMHYERNAKWGTPLGERFDRWGHRRGHPLYQCWRGLHRTRGLLCEGWSDFWVFAAGVGDRPSPGHRAFRRDKSRPYGPDNFEWRSTVTDVLQDGSREAKNAYQRAWFASHPRERKNADLRKYYGIGLDEYEAMVAQQNGTCAICPRLHGSPDRKTGEPKSLAVDHDHKSGAVRGLLCDNCNRMLGMVNDDIDTLRRAISYLESHAQKAA